MKATKPLLLLMALSVAASIAFAGVFVYYPVSVSVSQAAPPVVFDTGSNANKQDLDGTIDVSISENYTKVNIQLHPTYQKTYYQDILHINNTGSSTYYVSIRVTHPAYNLPAGSTAYMYVNGTQVNLMVENTTSIGQINPGQILQVDFEFNIPGGNHLVTDSIEIQLIYSPESTPPP